MTSTISRVAAMLLLGTMSRITMRRIKYVVLLICCGLPLSTSAASPKPALTRDVDRAGSAGAMLRGACASAAFCTVTTPIPAGKRFVSSYISYVLQYTVLGTPAIVQICSDSSCSSSSRRAFLPIGAVTLGGGPLITSSTGTPITIVLEAGETPTLFSVFDTVLTPSLIDFSILGHFEDI